jgi:hypothetical protein
MSEHFYSTTRCYIPKESTLHMQCLLPASCQLLPWFTLSLGGSMFLWNVRALLLNNTVLHTKRKFSSHALLAACFLLVSCSTYSLTLKTETVISSKMSVNIYQATQCYIQDHILHRLWSLYESYWFIPWPTFWPKLWRQYIHLKFVGFYHWHYITEPIKIYFACFLQSTTV